MQDPSASSDTTPMEPRYRQSSYGVADISKDIYNDRLPATILDIMIARPLLCCQILVDGISMTLISSIAYRSSSEIMLTKDRYREHQRPCMSYSSIVLLDAGHDGLNNSHLSLAGAMHIS